MKLMKCTRLFPLILVLCGILTVPVWAESSSFQDISDPETAVAADVLRLMDVIAGSGENRFQPDSHLTRAEFCVMAVKIMGRGDDVPVYTTRTIFSDVTAQHWARGYVNLAASISLGEGENAGRLIAGIGDGRFLPDDPVTYAQAVTILVRMLGYGDAITGAVWPTGYLNQAESLGLTENLGRDQTDSVNSPISRGQAARLFVNMIDTKTNSGVKYYETLGTVSEDVLCMAVGVTETDGISGGIRTSKGTYLPKNRGVLPVALQGLRGSLVLNEREEITAFLPDGSDSIVLTLSEDAQATYLRAVGGKRYSISSTTPTFRGEESEVPYSDLWMELHVGTQVTLFMDSGKVIGLYYAETSQADLQDAVVVYGELNRASFRPIVGDTENYTIRKAGQEISISDIAPYDVATYNASGNVLEISDSRLRCVYESAEPNTRTPTVIRVLGHDFPVLESALDTVGQFRLGQTVVLLLTVDGQVAGMVGEDSGLRSTLFGIAESGGVTVELPSGKTIQFQGDNSPEPDAQNQVVTVSGGKDNTLIASRLLGLSVPGTFDIDAMTLGRYPVAASVKVYEQVGKSAVTAMRLADLEMDSIPAAKIANYRLNSSGMVDIVILDAATGDAYKYGRFVFKVEGDGDSDNPVNVLTFENGTDEISFPRMGYSGPRNGYVGVALEQGNKLISYEPLNAIGGVQRRDFFQRNELWYVQVNGVVYPVSEKVEGYNKTTKKWITQELDRLSAIRAQSNNMTLYIDPVGNKVRVIEVQ